MTDDKLDEIEKALNRVSLGPWRQGDRGRGLGWDCLVFSSERGFFHSELEMQVCECSMQTGYAPEVDPRERALRNAELIANAPEYITWLIAEVRRLRGKILHFRRRER